MKNTQEFIDRANLVHGFRYTYGKSIYVNNETKLIITCAQYGDFEQMPINHLNGQGNPKCAGIGRKKIYNMNKKKTTQKFIDQANLIHNFKYTYEKSEYVNNNNKLIIICPVHGNFEQTATNHLENKGCSKCNEQTENNFHDE